MLTLSPGHALKNPALDPAREPRPSIVKQRPDVFFYEFPAAQCRQTQYFNPSLCDWSGARWLVARRRRFLRHPGKNDIVMWRLGADGRIPRFSTPHPVKFYSPRNDEHWEDPRAMVHRGELYLSYSTFYTRGSHVAQGFAEVNAFRQAMRTSLPNFGVNGPTLVASRGNEKNWVWWCDEQAPESVWRFVYTPAPRHVVATLAGDAATVCDSPGIAWEYGLPRGGTPPVMSSSDLLWSFFHSSVDISPVPPRRRYFMGAYAFEPVAPFRPVLMTPEPILVASEEDPREPSAPYCVFPCGALLDNGVWSVSLGVNDCACAGLRIAHTELVSLCRNI